MTMNNSPDYETMVLDKIQLNIKKVVSPAVLDSMKFEAQVNPVIDQIIMQLKLYLLGNKIHSEVIETIKYPKTWQEAIKERFLPGFLKRWFPVKYETVNKTIQFLHICPHLNIRIPPEGNQVHIAFLRKEK